MGLTARELDAETVRSVAGHLEDMARHLLAGEVQAAITDGSFHEMAGLLRAVQAHLTAALVLRETYDVDLNFHGG